MTHLRSRGSEASFCWDVENMEEGIESMGMSWGIWVAVKSEESSEKSGSLLAEFVSESEYHGWDMCVAGAGI